MGSVTEATILHHFCIVLLLLWFLNSFYHCHPVAYFLSLMYLYLVHEGYVLRLRKTLQFEEKRDSNQRRVLLESESVRWLNYAIEKIWLVCVEEIVSQKILLPIFPWFLKKYKPWTVKDVEAQHLYLGRSPPIITEMRVVQQSSGDDHLVLELGMNFRTADDMSAILGVKLRKRLGFGMLAKMHLLGLHVEGKVLVGVKFLSAWPFISRLRVCFTEPPYFQMTAKPIFSHGLDVTELPGIAGWIDNLLALVFEQTLVEPNMLVVDVEKFASPHLEKWFSVDTKEPIAHAIVEVLEAAEMKPSDSNGLADPYIRGQLGHYRFRTKTRRKTLAPKWLEEFKIPICSWDSDNTLVLKVRDKDRLFDDTMGDCCVNINELRDGQRHDIWLPLENIRMGRLHLAVTVSSEGTGKVAETWCNTEDPNIDIKKDSPQQDSSTLNLSPKIPDKFEPIDIEGKPETGIWIHHPGTEVPQVWEPRKGKTRNQIDIQELNKKIQNDCENESSSSSSDEGVDPTKSPSKVQKGLRKISVAFRKSMKNEDTITPTYQRTTGKEMEDGNGPESPHVHAKEVGNGPESPHVHAKEVAKSILKQAGKSARSLKKVLSKNVSRKSMNKDTSFLEHGSEEDDVSPSSLTRTGSEVTSVPNGVQTATTPSGSSSNGFFESTDSTVPTGNNSLNSVDGVQAATTPSGNGFFEYTVPTGNNSLNSAEGTDKTPE